MTKGTFKEQLVNVLTSRGWACDIVRKNSGDKLEVYLDEKNITASIDLDVAYAATHEVGISVIEVANAIERRMNTDQPEIMALRNAITKRSLDDLELYPVLRSTSVLKKPDNVLFTVISGTDLIVGWKIRLKGNTDAAIWLTEEIKAYLHITKEEMESSIKTVMKDARLLSVSHRYDLSLDLVKEDLYKPRVGFDPISMFTLTSSNVNEGAVLLTFSEVRRLLLKNYPGYRVVIPSSIHEILLVHESTVATEDDVRTLEEQIRTVNMETVDESEVLSSHVYWICDDGSLKML